MQSYNVTTADAIIIDGQQFAANEVVAVIETALPIDQVLSGAAFGRLKVSPGANRERLVDPQSPAIEPVKVDKPSDINVDDVDALNKADREADEAEAKAKAEAEAKAAAEAASLDPSFNGLDVRIAKSLVAAKLANRQAVADYAAEHDNDFEDIEGIGKKAVAKINEWLAS